MKYWLVVIGYWLAIIFIITLLGEALALLLSNESFIRYGLPLLILGSILAGIVLTWLTVKANERRKARLALQQDPSDRQ